MKRTISGFTIVELLVVIVVIGILASVTVVAYNGISQRAGYVSMRSDISQINKLIQVYYTDKGYYPISRASGTGCDAGYWCGYGQATADNFIPGIVPEYASRLPQLPAEDGGAYLYKSINGSDYKLIRFKNGLSASEQAAFTDMRTSGCGSTYDVDRWGYWSSNASRCW